MSASLDERRASFWRTLSPLGYTMGEAYRCFDTARDRHLKEGIRIENALDGALYEMQQEKHQRSLKAQQTGEPTLRVGLFEAAAVRKARR